MLMYQNKNSKNEEHLIKGLVESTEQWYKNVVKKLTVNVTSMEM